MCSKCLAVLREVLQTDSVPESGLEAALEEACGERIVLSPGRTIPVRTALYRCEQLRPEIRVRVERWIRDRFSALMLTQNDATSWTVTPEDQRPGPEDAPAFSKTGAEAAPMAPSTKVSAAPGPHAAKPEVSNSPAIRFEDDPFDRFLEWVSAFVRMFWSR